MGFFIYGVAAYLVFLLTFLYAIGFVGNVVVPKSIDTGLEGPFTQALLVDALLLGLFAIQHSIMPRQWFKKWWTGFIPEQIERSTYVLFSSLLLALLFWQWRPMTAVVWDIEHPAGRLPLRALFWLGWFIVLAMTFAIDHFDLFGLRQVYLHLRGVKYTPVGFRSPLPYRFVRHPLMLGFIIAFLATPTMSLGHLVFAIGTTAYTLVGIVLEERDLVAVHGEEYERYRRRTSMLIPWAPRKPSDGS